jgi:hypothetical protein
LTILRNALKCSWFNLLRNLSEAPTVAAMAELLIARETKPGRTEQIAQMLTRLKRMLAADRQKMLEQKRKLHSRA